MPKAKSQDKAKQYRLLQNTNISLENIETVSYMNMLKASLLINIAKLISLSYIHTVILNSKHNA